MSRPATTRLKCNDQVGRRPSLEFRPLGDLGIDAAYQRSIEGGESQALIRRIAVHWDWSLCQPLTVARREDGSLWVVDGQHRLSAAKLRRDIYDLPCVIVASGGMADEAAAFVALNDQRKRLDPLDRFRAALASGDEAACGALAAIEAAGLSLAPHSNWVSWKPGMISNVGGVLKLQRVAGVAVTRRALKVLAVAFAGEVLRWGGTLFAGIGGTIAADPEGIDDELLTMVLQAQSQREWMTEIGVARVTLGKTWGVVGRAVIGRSYTEALDDDG